MRRIPGPIGLALGLLVAGCGSAEVPGPPPASLATGTATTASATTASVSEPPAASTGPASGSSPAVVTSRTAAQTTRRPPPPKSTPSTAKPPAKGSPVRTAPIDIVGSSYAQTGPLTKAQLTDECGGTLCVEIAETVEGPPDPGQDCTVKRIIQSVPIYRGDRITVVLSDPCGGFTESEPPPSS